MECRERHLYNGEGRGFFPNVMQVSLLEILRDLDCGARLLRAEIIRDGVRTVSFGVLL